MQTFRNFISSICLLLIGGSVFAQVSGVTAVRNEDRTCFQSVDLGKTWWTNGFMKDVWDRTSTVTIPYLWERYNNPRMAGYALNMQRTAKGEKGAYLNGGITFSDGDFYKWMEAACYVLAIDPHSKWDAVLDEIATDINKVQARAVSQFGSEFNGYLSTKDQLAGNPIVGGGQVYNFGHLMTTGAIHHRVTGKETLLNAAKKTGDFLWKRIQLNRDEPSKYWDHTVIMGGVELFRETGDNKYLNISEYIVNSKGNFPGSKNYKLNAQVNGPLINQYKAVGHAQRANYLYAGAIDSYIEGADEGYLDMGRRLFKDIVIKRMYLHGGTGAIHGFNPACDHWHQRYPNPPGEPVAENCDVHVSEAYGPDYYLPNEAAYCEGCAQCGMALFSWRMLQSTGEAKYADVLELELFNGILGGVSLEGDNFYYTNKLERLSDAVYQMDSRRRTGSSAPENNPNSNTSHETQCCPPNYARLLAMSPNMVYGINSEKHELWVNLYGSSHVSTKLKDETVIDISQLADEFPWNGDIKFIVNKAGTYAVKLRIPKWSNNTSISINGVSVDKEIVPGSYYVIPVTDWVKGDKIEMSLDIQVQIIEGNSLTKEAQTGKIAIKRGPLLYCAEREDNPQSKTGYVFADLGIDTKMIFVTEHNDDLDVLALKKGNVYLIPYYAWSNRKDNYMKVWLQKY